MGAAPGRREASARVVPATPPLDLTTGNRQACAHAKTVPCAPQPSGPGVSPHSTSSDSRPTIEPLAIHVAQVSLDGLGRAYPESGHGIACETKRGTLPEQLKVWNVDLDHAVARALPDRPTREYRASPCTLRGRFAVRVSPRAGRAAPLHRRQARHSGLLPAPAFPDESVVAVLASVLEDEAVAGARDAHELHVVVEDLVQHLPRCEPFQENAVLLAHADPQLTGSVDPERLAA
eukprot:2554320-Rhodomonas_salina.2